MSEMLRLARAMILAQAGWLRNCPRCGRGVLRATNSGHALRCDKCGHDVEPLRAQPAPQAPTKTLDARREEGR